MACEKREGAADIAIDLGLPAARKRTELFGIQQRFINPLGARLKILFLMDGLAAIIAFLLGIQAIAPGYSLGHRLLQATEP